MRAGRKLWRQVGLRIEVVEQINIATSEVTITKPNVQRTCAAKYPASETKRAVRVLDRSSKCLGRGRLDPLLDVRFVEQALRLQKLADLYHGAMDNWVSYDGTEKSGLELLIFLEILRPFAARLGKSAAHLAERLGLESDAARSARHQRNLSAEIKQLVRLVRRFRQPRKRLVQIWRS